MNWGAFWSGLLGTTIPSMIVSLLVIHLSRQFNRSLERLKTELQQDVVRFTKWHEKRVDASVAIYAAFDDYLDFLRKRLYVETSSGTMDGMHDFNRTIQRQIVFLDDALAETVLQYRGELLVFWNDTMLGNKVATEETRTKLDYDIPTYLPRLRREINKSLDPNYASPDSSKSSLLLYTERPRSQK